MKKLILLIFGLSSLLSAQHSDPFSYPYEMGIMNGNSFITSFYDDAHISDFRTGIDIRGRWKDNDYIGDLTPLLGIELPIKDYDGDGINDTIHSVIISRGPRKGQSVLMEGHPVQSYFWGWNPVVGYKSSTFAGPAISTDPSTWPASWPDHPEYGSDAWNGFFGKNNFDFDLEAYFAVDDYWDTEANMKYGFFPDYADTNIPGHGIKMSVRLLQLTNDVPEEDLFLNDMLFRVYDITNTSKHTYEKMVFGNITGSLSGGDGDSGDDLAEYDPEADVVLSYDFDGKGNYGQDIGVLGEAILVSPTDDKIHGFSFFNLSTSPDLSDDERLWQWMKPGSFPSQAPVPQDGDHILYSDYFSLVPGETKRFVFAIIMGDTKDDVKKKARIAEAVWNNNFDQSAAWSAVQVAYPGQNQTLSGAQEVKWTSNRSSGTIDLLFSRDAGETWTMIEDSIANTGSYMWNTEPVDDCAFGRLAFVLRADDGDIYGYRESDFFAVDNSMNGKVFFKIVGSNPEITGESLITDERVEFSFLAGDPEKAPLNLDVYFSSNNGKSYDRIMFYDIESQTTAQSISLVVNYLSNTAQAKLKFVLSEGTDVSSDSTVVFTKHHNRDQVPEEYVERIAGESPVPIVINKLDKSLMNGHEYLITFNDLSSEKLYDVYDITENNKILIDDAVLYAGQESQMFDGLTFTAEDIVTSLDSARTRWSDSGENNGFAFTLKSMKQIYSPAYNHCADYRIVFHDEVVDTSVDITKLITTYRNHRAQPVKFEIWNISTGKKIKFAYAKTGTITSNLNIVLLEDIDALQRVTWNMLLQSLQANQYPAAGDTAYIFTKKGLSIYDSVKVRSIPLSVDGDGNVAAGYELYQNYPNPFNAVTKIKYSVPEVSHVEIVVYDLLGKKVRTIINEVRQAGMHEVYLDAAGLTSGVYFFQIKSGGFSASRKFVLLK